MKKIPQEQKKKEENLIKEVSFVEKELLLNSLTQQELLKTTKDLNGTIKELTKTLKEKFKLENPQIEISEVENPNMDANIVAERIADSLEKFGANRFKGIGHKILTDVMNAGALGIEVVISGKIPSARAKTWRFAQGYMIKTGDSAKVVDRAQATAQTKPGTVGVKVSILKPDAILKDKLTINDELITKLSENKKEFERLVKLGNKLRGLHLMTDPECEKLITKYSVPGSYFSNLSTCSFANLTFSQLIS